MFGLKYYRVFERISLHDRSLFDLCKSIPDALGKQALILSSAQQRIMNRFVERCFQPFSSFMLIGYAPVKNASLPCPAHSKGDSLVGSSLTVPTQTVSFMGNLFGFGSTNGNKVMNHDPLSANVKETLKGNNLQEKLQYQRQNQIRTPISQSPFAKAVVDFIKNDSIMLDSACHVQTYQYTSEDCNDTKKDTDSENKTLPQETANEEKKTDPYISPSQTTSLFLKKTFF
ncbi:hypothetical protein RFI_26873 [Reticulomyxa filosa]|uniref:Uncharacterized protein n=1 Tax=Reticulomyxa filosa TaxID=46433 RepID=X6MA29_RETFI|nr:hypothetical protein RFI_26873 [Reticulomyxa filosa]|eukprot:ETO10506.1 hypothetical protein RFI_26873 [Reticulomyxa filosa]